MNSNLEGHRLYSVCMIGINGSLHCCLLLPQKLSLCGKHGGIDGRKGSDALSDDYNSFFGNPAAQL